MGSIHNTGVRMFWLQAEKKARQKVEELERKAAANEKKKKAEEGSKAALVRSMWQGKHHSFGLYSLKIFKVFLAFAKLRYLKL